jgi:hypothetical protein
MQNAVLPTFANFAFKKIPRKEKPQRARRLSKNAKRKIQKIFFPFV